MRTFRNVADRLLSRVRVSPSGTAPSKNGRARPPAQRRRPRVKAHVAPAPPPARPTLGEVTPFIRMERDVGKEFRPQMLAALKVKVETAAKAREGEVPSCSECGKPMGRHDTRTTSWLTRYGRLHLGCIRYACPSCSKRRRPFLEWLGVEPGRISGSLGRLMALLGVVVPYELAAQLVGIFFGVTVSPMAVWRAVQRLGEPASQFTDALSAYHADSRSDAPETSSPPDAVLVGVDGCVLGMAVRKTRRRRKTAQDVLPPLTPVEEGHFREVKTAVLLLPAERVEPSPGRRSVLRRVLVTCLGDADAIFSRLWAEMRERGWLAAKTVVVIVGDGSAWIWNRATLFANRCEILDFWHAIEYVWSYARLQFGEGSPRADRFVHRIARDLKAGKVHDVIARFKRLHPVSDEARAALDAVIKYYTDNASRMQYDKYLRLGYGIGSGAVESAHKQVVHARLRQAGMRWSEDGARRLLALRLLLLNGDWAMVDRLRMVPIAA